MESWQSLLVMAGLMYDVSPSFDINIDRRNPSRVKGIGIWPEPLAVVREGSLAVR
jgi:hypothetical protein